MIINIHFLRGNLPGRQIRIIRHSSKDKVDLNHVNCLRLLTPLAYILSKVCLLIDSYQNFQNPSCRI